MKLEFLNDKAILAELCRELKFNENIIFNKWE